MLNAKYLEHTDLLEGPLRQLFREFLVDGLGVTLPTWCLDRCIEPLVLQHLERSEDSEASGVPCLHGRDQYQLRPCCKRLLYAFTLFPGVVRISCVRRLQDGRKQRTCVS